MEKNLIEGTRFTKAQIVVSSNPFVSYHLYNYVNRRVELYELVKSIRNKFVSEALKNFPNRLKILQENLLEYSEADMLSYVPINMAILVMVSSHTPCSEYHKPSYAMSIMYPRFYGAIMKLNSLFIHGERYKHENLWYTLKDASKQLNYFAYVSLIKNKSVFLEEDLFDMCKKYPICYGFMQSTECYSSAYHNKRTLFNFLCQGVQQYLATGYITIGSLTYILENSLATKTLNLFHFMPINWSMQVLNVCILEMQGKNVDEDTISRIINNLDEENNSYNIHLHNSKYFKSTKQKSHTARGIGSFINVSSAEKFDVNSEQDELIPKRPLSFIDSGYTSFHPSPYSLLVSHFPPPPPSPPPFLSLCVYQIFPLNNGVKYNIAEYRKIDFTHYYLLPYHMTSLGLYLSRNKQIRFIRELHLGDCSIGDYGLYLLSSYLCNYSSEGAKLNVINLHKNNLTAASSLIINNIIDHLKPDSLELSYNNLTDTGLAKICSPVIRNQVHVLNLAENGLTAQGTKSIIVIINVLKELDISHNDIGDHGAKALSQGLAHTVALKRLDISRCNIGEVGARELAHALTINSSLEILRMKGNPIGHTGAADLIAILCISNTLKEFSVSGIATRDHAAASQMLKS